MRVAGKPATARLATEPIEVGLAGPPFEEGPRVDAGRRVPLDEDLVPESTLILAVKEVVEADLIERGCGGVGGQMAADAIEAAVGAGHHHGCVPAHEITDPTLEIFVARIERLVRDGDGVDVVGADDAGQVETEALGSLENAQHHASGASSAAILGEGVDGVGPLLQLLSIRVRELADESVGVHETAPWDRDARPISLRCSTSAPECARSWVAVRMTTEWRSASWRRWATAPEAGARRNSARYRRANSSKRCGS